MSIKLNYVGEDESQWILSRDENGFWVSNSNMNPITFKHSVAIPEGATDSSISFQINGNDGDWFQIDDVSVSTFTVGDELEYSVRDYNDATSDDNPQLYNEYTTLPISLSESLVPVNEFITDTTLKSVIGKLQENYKFILDKGSFLSVPPNGPAFRYGPSSYAEYPPSDNVWQQMDSYHYNFLTYTNELEVNSVVANSEFMAFSDTEAVAVSAVSFNDGVSPNVTDRNFYIYGEDSFTKIVSLELDSNDFIWVLDDTYIPGGMTTPSKIGIFSYGDGVWKFKSSWGSDDINSGKYFVNPIDLKIQDGRVYLACSTKGRLRTDEELEELSATYIPPEIVVATTYQNSTLNGTYELDSELWNGEYPTYVMDTESAQMAWDNGTWRLLWPHPGDADFNIVSDALAPPLTGYTAVPPITGELEIQYTTPNYRDLSANAYEGVEIRVFDEVGTYFGAISHEDLTTIESIAITEDYVIVLFDNKLYKFDKSFNFIEIIDLFEQIKDYIYGEITPTYIDSTITKLANSNNSIFFYGIAGNLIYKFGQSGTVLESFGEGAVNYINSVVEESIVNKRVNNLYHSDNNYLYSASDYDIVKYYDRGEISTRLWNDLSYNADEGVWDYECLGANKSENITAWVYNRIFDRILDNLNGYRTSLQGYQTLMTTSTFEKIVVDNFTPSQFTRLPYEKGDIAIGINELHCEGALNRCIRQLYECFETCLGLLNIKGVDVDPETLKIISFDLSGSDAEKFNDVYYFEEGREISGFTFEWEDTIPYRGDPKLGGGFEIPNSPEPIKFGKPIPTKYTDGYNALSAGSHTWTLTETFLSLTKEADVTINWNKQIYYGTVDYATSYDGPTLVSAGNLQGTYLDPAASDIITINVEDNRLYYIAIPADEWDTLGLYHPDLSYDPLWEYIISGDNLIEVDNFQTVYGDMGSYYVVMPDKNEVTVSQYAIGVEEIKFKMIRS